MRGIMLDPKGRVIMLSGANRGIGLAIAQCLHGKGYSLSLAARDAARLGEIFAGATGPDLSFHHYDAEAPETAARWVQDTASTHGRINGLVNNAGMYKTVTLEGEPGNDDEADLDALWRVNVKGPLLLTRAAYSHLKASGQGRVINVASLSGKRVVGNSLGYGLTKFAVMGLTHQIRHDGWEHGIRASAVCPSFVKSDMATGITEMAVSEMTQPEDVAELVATLIALPNTAAVPEITVNWRYEGIY
jgi:NAD(P)-dependent dehydrogenase (short-subunit alcohol dehydrogenase family)